jgi:hypothetical protein
MLSLLNIVMLTRPVNSFRKTLACPSDHDLLEFHLTDLPINQMRIVKEHLGQCEFCSAEMHLLESFPQADLCCCDETAVLPAALRRLAEALMGRGAPSLRALYEIAPERETVKH